MIYLLWATVRPTMMKETYKIWMDKAKYPSNIQVNLAVNTQEQRNQLSEFDGVIITNQKFTGTVYPIFLMTTQLDVEDDDIIIVVSDDFYPPDNWDEHLTGKLKDKCACYFVNDGYQNPDITTTGMNKSITMPVMTFSCLKKLNKILYSLDYVHFYGDTELYNNLFDLGLVIDDRINDTTLYTHRNWAVANGRASDKHDAAYNIFAHQDRHTYVRREGMSVNERIKLTKGVW